MIMGFGHGYKHCIEMDEMVTITDEQVKLLGAIIDSKVKFDDHVKSQKRISHSVLMLTETLVLSPGLLKAHPRLTQMQIAL